MVHVHNTYYDSLPKVSDVKVHVHNYPKYMLL